MSAVAARRFRFPLKARTCHAQTALCSDLSAVARSARLAGVADRIQYRLDSAAHPVRRDDRIAAHNLAEVPTLILEDGTACSATASSANTWPIWARRQGFFRRPARAAGGRVDLASAGRRAARCGAAGALGFRRPAQWQWPAWREAQLAKVAACLDAIDQLAPSWPGTHPALARSRWAAPWAIWISAFPNSTGAPATRRALGGGAAALPAMRATLPHETLRSSPMNASTPASVPPPDRTIVPEQPQRQPVWPGRQQDLWRSGYAGAARGVTCERRAASLGLGLKASAIQHEGQLVDWIQEARGQAPGLIINAAGLTYSSVPILDALLAFPSHHRGAHEQHLAP